MFVHPFDSWQWWWLCLPISYIIAWFPQWPKQAEGSIFWPCRVLTIVISCVKLITSNSECNTRSLTYVYKNWCYHLYMVLSCGKDIGHMLSHLGQGVTALVVKLLQYFEDWMVAIGDSHKLERVQNDLQSALHIIKVCLAGMPDTKSSMLDTETMDCKCVSHPRHGANLQQHWGE